MNTAHRRLTTVAAAGALATLAAIGISSDSMAQTRGAAARSSIDSRRRRSRVDPEIGTPEAPSDVGTLAVTPRAVSRGTFREAPAASTIAPTASIRRGRHSTHIDEDTVVRAAFVQRQPLHLRGGREGRRRSRADVQRAVLPRMSPEHRDRRREPGGRAPHRAPGTAAVRGVGGWLADPVAFDAIRTSSSGCRSKTACSTLRISTNMLGAGFIEAIANDTLLAIRDRAARGDPRHGAGGGGARGQQRAAHRAVRLEEPAREPGIVRGRRLPQRDGHHHAGAAGREHLAGPHRRLRHALRSGGRIRKTTAWMSGRSRTSCARPRLRRAARSTRTVRAGERCSTRWDAAAAMSRPIRTAAPGHAHQRRGDPRARCGGQQDHPSVQRLPAA